VVVVAADRGQLIPHVRLTAREPCKFPVAFVFGIGIVRMYVPYLLLFWAFELALSREESEQISSQQHFTPRHSAGLALVRSLVREDEYGTRRWPAAPDCAGTLALSARLGEPVKEGRLTAFTLRHGAQIQQEGDARRRVCARVHAHAVGVGRNIASQRVCARRVAVRNDMATFKISSRIGGSGRAKAVARKLVAVL
jgi:hypothetical protein